MSRNNPFSMHRQSFWEEVSAGVGLPLWQRVAALAFACHRRNGHANFVAKNHELAFLLANPEKHGSECVPVDQISRAIARAKKAGWISEQSNSHCLAIPMHAISGGLGREYEKCAIHKGRRTGSSARLRVA